MNTIQSFIACSANIYPSDALIASLGKTRGIRLVLLRHFSEIPPQSLVFAEALAIPDGGQPKRVVTGENCAAVLEILPQPIQLLGNGLRDFAAVAVS